MIVMSTNHEGTGKTCFLAGTQGFTPNETEATSYSASAAYIHAKAQREKGLTILLRPQTSHEIFALTQFMRSPQEEVAMQHQGTGRWYITMGRPGFNSRANNADGYASKEAAIAASERYGSR